MTKDPKDLWPEFGDDEQLTTPLSILREQSSYLSKKTQGLLDGEVVTSTEEQYFFHNFNIVSSVLDYTYRLFRVRHDITLYPLKVNWAGFWHDVDDEAGFREFLGRILADESTRRVVLALLAQAKS